MNNQARERQSKLVFEPHHAPFSITTKLTFVMGNWRNWVSLDEKMGIPFDIPTLVLFSVTLSHCNLAGVEGLEPPAPGFGELLDNLSSFNTLNTLCKYIGLWLPPPMYSQHIPAIVIVLVPFFVPNRFLFQIKWKPTCRMKRTKFVRSIPFPLKQRGCWPPSPPLFYLAKLRGKYAQIFFSLSFNVYFN